MTHFVKHKKNKKARFILLVIISLMMCIWPFSAAAADPIDYSHLCTLELNIVYAGTNIEGMVYHLFATGTGDEASSFSLAGQFAGYPVSLTGLDASGWQAAADELAGYAEADGLTPIATGVSDVNGQIFFTGLPAGLYMVVGEDLISGYSLFEVSPFLIALPHLQAGGTWLYDVSAHPKVTDPVRIPGGTPPPGTVTVLPQTGWLGWPIPVMAVLGILLFSIGWWRRYQNNEQRKEE